MTTKCEKRRTGSYSLGIHLKTHPVSSQTDMMIVCLSRTVIVSEHATLLPTHTSPSHGQQCLLVDRNHGTHHPRYEPLTLVSRPTGPHPVTRTPVWGRRERGTPSTRHAQLSPSGSVRSATLGWRRRSGQNRLADGSAGRSRLFVDDHRLSGAAPPFPPPTIVRLLRTPAPPARVQIHGPIHG